MQILLPKIFKYTPDIVNSLDKKGSDTNKYIWKFFSKSKTGLEIKLEPFEDYWRIIITEVEWDGEDYIYDENPETEKIANNMSEAISISQQQIKQLQGMNKYTKIYY